MELPTYFSDFLAEIRPSEDERERFKTAHRRLRERLQQDEELSDLLVSLFLQGSYRRSTALRNSGRSRPDVDVVAVTTMDPQRYPPEKAMIPFHRFLREHYPRQWQTQGRSLGITDTDLDVDLDLVITASPSEATVALQQDGSRSEDEPLEDEPPSPPGEEPAWKKEPLLVPDRELKQWQATHPLAQLAWTREKNRATSGHFVNVVKALKWWKCQSKLPKHPKSYPLERLIGECCPDSIGSVAEGITQTLETLLQRYQVYTPFKWVPSLQAPGVPASNVLARLSGEDFAAFIDGVAAAAPLARRALDAADVAQCAALWRELLGDKFPAAEGGYNTPSAPAVLGGTRFA